MSELHPGASSYLDRHGKRRWRFRRAGKTIPLPGVPGVPEFEAAYMAAIEGRAVRKADIHRLPTAAVPKSLRAAWRVLTTETPEWKDYDEGYKRTQTLIAERFFATPVVEGEPLTFGAVAVINLQRKHVKAIIARRSDTPHAAKHLLRLIRKLTGVALDQEWIEQDPTYRISYRPKYKGWKAWPPEMCAKFEAYWPIGSTPRLVYSLALYFGHRRSDVARVKWSDLEVGGTNAVQKKGDKALYIPTLPVLAEVLAATERRGDYVVLTKYGLPFSVKALGMRMQAWTAKAGLPPGYTLHGLRKALGKALAEGGATTRQIMAVLGHDDIEHAELYSREAEQKRLAQDGMRLLLPVSKKSG